MKSTASRTKPSSNSDLRSRLLAESEQVHAQQIKWRRHLHENPELSNEEFETTAFLRKEAERIGLRILPLKMSTGLLAELRGAKPGPTIAIRTDIDALPITEQSDVPFRSKRPGKMHACGHDMHMATILGTAALLDKFRDELSGTVRFLFQPAEETPPGGARPMIENGALKDVRMIFGLHVDPHLQAGKIGLRDGVTMASVTDFDLIVRGKSGHAARPHLAVDAIVTAAEMIESIQKVVSREIDPITPVAITFGSIEGGTARNVIAEEVKIVGTARALSAASANALPKLIRKTAHSVAKGRGASVEMKIIASYPVLKNEKTVNTLYRNSFESLFGKGKVEETPMVLGAEDFACYLEKVPGAMFRLGTMNKKINADQPWHSPKFKADESALRVGAALLAMATMNALNGNR